MLHVLFIEELEVNVTLPPVQNVVGPFGVIVGADGVVNAVPVAETKALLHPELLLSLAYSVIVDPAVTDFVFDNPVPSSFVIPFVDHSIVFPAPGLSTVNVIFPLSHLV